MPDSRNFICFVHKVSGKYFSEQSQRIKTYSKKLESIDIKCESLELGEFIAGAKFGEFTILIVPSCKNWAFRNISQYLLF